MKIKIAIEICEHLTENFNSLTNQARNRNEKALKSLIQEYQKMLIENLQLKTQYRTLQNQMLIQGYSKQFCNKNLTSSLMNTLTSFVGKIV